jgi:hypothetical protein
MSPDYPNGMHGADVPCMGHDLHGPDVLAELRAEVERLKHDRTAAQECAQRTQADGNLLADRLFAQEARHRAAIDGWRQVCIDHGITPDAGSLRCALRRLADHACVGACEGRCGQ